MPVFINDSRKDKEFANKLALNLVRHKASVWIDEWEVFAGDSLIEKIQDAIEGASVMLAIFSKASVNSIWCKREVTAGIQRELEQHRVVVVPVLLEDCDMPIFLRDKKYADFRTDCDEGMHTVLESIARFTSTSLGRDETGDFCTDWSKDLAFLDGNILLEFTLIHHSPKSPYSVFTQIWVIGTEEATERFKVYADAGFTEVGELIIAEVVVSALEGREFFVVLEDARKKEKVIEIQDPATGIGYVVRMESRRLGTDTGRDILMHGADELRKIRDMIKERIRPPTRDEAARLLDLVRRNQSR